MSIAVERAGIADIDVVGPLFDAYRQFYGQPADPARARAWISERLRRDEAIILLASRDGRPCGFTQLYRMFSSVRTARLWILNDLYVMEDARRHGVARALLDAAADSARAEGAAGLMLETSQDNVAARALYRAAGWQEDASQWYSFPLR
jgi:GNAT superfamily N-acetyltransferase